MRELAWFLLGALALCVFASWVSKHKPRSTELAWRVRDGAARLPLFEAGGGQEREPAAAPPVRQHEDARPELSQPAAVARPRKRLTQLMKKRIAARDQWRCQICKQLVSANYEIDHIVAQSVGGGHEASNLRTLCRECHGNVTARQRLKP